MICGKFIVYVMFTVYHQCFDAFGWVAGATIDLVKSLFQQFEKLLLGDQRNLE